MNVYWKKLWKMRVKKLYHTIDHLESRAFQGNILLSYDYVLQEAVKFPITSWKSNKNPFE